MKAILEFLSKNNRWAVVLVIILLLLGGGLWKLQRNKINEWKDKYQTEVKLKNALVDTVHYYKNSYGEVVAEKLTLQASVKDLEKIRDQLTAEQQELLRRVREANKKNTVITAALIKAEFIIDSLMAKGPVVINSKDTTITFSDTTKYLEYQLVVGKAIPVRPDIEPTLLFKHLRFPNTQEVKFEWENNKKEGYPIKFSIANSSPYYKVNEINSYAIPNLKKEVINPTGWEKVGIWLKKNGKIVGYVAGGVVIGAGGTYFLMK